MCTVSATYEGSEDSGWRADAHANCTESLPRLMESLHYRGALMSTLWQLISIERMPGVLTPAGRTAASAAVAMMTAFAMRMHVELPKGLADTASTTAGTQEMPAGDNKGIVLCDVWRMRSGRLAADDTNSGGGGGGGGEGTAG